MLPALRDFSWELVGVRVLGAPRSPERTFGPQVTDRAGRLLPPLPVSHCLFPSFHRRAEESRWGRVAVHLGVAAWIRAHADTHVQHFPGALCPHSSVSHCPRVSLLRGFQASSEPMARPVLSPSSVSPGSKDAAPPLPPRAGAPAPGVSKRGDKGAWEILGKRGEVGL